MTLGLVIEMMEFFKREMKTGIGYVLEIPCKYTSITPYCTSSGRAHNSPVPVMTLRRHLGRDVRRRIQWMEKQKSLKSSDN
jgi:hypothetical protein